MKTRCPDCQTVFRVTPEQLRARAGKVRCGHCQGVFNALDSLLEEHHHAATAPEHPVPPSPPTAGGVEAMEAMEARLEPAIQEEPDDSDRSTPLITEEADLSVFPADVDFDLTTPLEKQLDAGKAREIGKAAGLILPRDTTEIPGYSKWAEDAVTTTSLAPEEKPSHWPFYLAAILLVLGLAGQIVFHFRTELSVALPSTRPLLEAFSQALNSSLPLPAQADLVSIEVSDLQTDTNRGNLLVLNATLRNRAPYGQAYPSLELSLTDTQDVAIVRRIIEPKEYLPARKPGEQAFPPNSNLSVRLWIEAKDVSAAGYRLFVFYP